MSEHYQVTVNNNSGTPQNFLIYQQMSIVPYNTMPLAWLTRMIPPGGMGSFSWAPMYDFYWAQAGPLQPGVRVFPSQMAGASRPGSNKIGLENQGEPSFTGTSSDPGNSGFGIQVAGNIPPGAIGIGMAINGSPAYVAPAEPNSDNMFEGGPRYFIAVGNAQQGEIIEPRSLMASAELRFQPGSTAISAVFEPDGTWRIS